MQLRVSLSANKSLGTSLAHKLHFYPCVNFSNARFVPRNAIKTSQWEAKEV